MTIRKALTFRASSIGDALNAKYLFENIHAAYPDARCGLVVAGRGGMIRDLLEAYPWIEVIETNRHDFKGLWGLWKNFHGSDLVITPAAKPGGRFGLFSKIAARALARRGALIGFRDTASWTPLVYSRTLAGDPTTHAPRRLEQDVLRTAGIPVAVPQMRLARVPQTGLLERLNLTSGTYLVLHLFAGSENRAMSQQKRQELISALASALPDVPLVLTGTTADAPYLRELTLPPHSMIVTGMLSVQELATLIAESGCMVSIGTGPSHMASHLGKKPIVLVICGGIPWCGPEQFDEEAGRIFSDTDACRHGHDTSAYFPSCIEGIDVEEVARAARAYFVTN